MSKVSKNGHGVSGSNEIRTVKLAANRFSGRDEEPEATRSGQKNAAPIAPTDTSKATRRQFTLEDKRRILRLADACTDQQQIGALLRREGMYHCTLQRFIAERDSARLDSGGIKAQLSTGIKDAVALRNKVAELERQNANLSTRLRKAEIVIDVQKKLSQMLSLEMDDTVSLDCGKS